MSAHELPDADRPGGANFTATDDTKFGGRDLGVRSLLHPRRRRDPSSSLSVLSSP